MVMSFDCYGFGFLREDSVCHLCLARSHLLTCGLLIGVAQNWVGPGVALTLDSAKDRRAVKCVWPSLRPALASTLEDAEDTEGAFWLNTPLQKPQPPSEEFLNQIF